MNVINSIIIDDEPLAHKIILKYAERVPFLEIVNQCYKATDAYEFLKAGNIELIFLDINMPKLSGLDFLRTLDQPPKVIVTSAYEEYALEGYELQVCDYLLKPFRFERFSKAVNIVYDKMKNDLRLNVNANVSNDASQQLAIKVDKKLIRVESKDIQYIESYGNYVKIWIDDKYYLTPRTLSSFEKELNAEIFMRIHKSYIVQKKFIEYQEGNSLKMLNENLLPIGKTHKKKLMSWIKKSI